MLQSVCIITDQLNFKKLENRESQKPWLILWRRPSLPLTKLMLVNGYKNCVSTVCVSEVMFRGVSRCFLAFSPAIFHRSRCKKCRPSCLRCANVGFAPCRVGSGTVSLSETLAGIALKSFSIFTRALKTRRVIHLIIFRIKYRHQAQKTCVIQDFLIRSRCCFFGVCAGTSKFLNKGHI